MTGFGLTPLYRPSLGIERLAGLFDMLERPSGRLMPRYDIEQTGENHYQLSLTVAGYAEKDLDIEASGNYLKITGQAEEDLSNRRFIHKGIEQRQFEQSFQLGDNIKITGSELKNGILKIEFERVVPETEKTRKIPIRCNS